MQFHSWKHSCLSLLELPPLPIHNVGEWRVLFSFPHIVPISWDTNFPSFLWLRSINRFSIFPKGCLFVCFFFLTSVYLLCSFLSIGLIILSQQVRTLFLKPFLSFWPMLYFIRILLIQEIVIQWWKIFKMNVIKNAKKEKEGDVTRKDP